MSRESADVKAARYLSQGRVIVDHVHGDRVSATVRGDGALHRVEHGRRGWSCSCTARGRCSHLLALGLITVVDRRVALSTQVDNGSVNFKKAVKQAVALPPRQAREGPEGPTPSRAAPQAQSPDPGKDPVTNPSY